MLKPQSDDVWCNIPVRCDGFSETLFTTEQNKAFKFLQLGENKEKFPLENTVLLILLILQYFDTL